MTKITLSSLWFFSTICYLLIGGMLLTQKYMSAHWQSFFPRQILGFTHQAHEVIASEASDEGLMIETAEASTSTLLFTADARAKLVANFIERNDHGHNSPLQPYEHWGRIFVEVADEYGIDFRLLPAIARKESTFCKSNIAKTYYNCFGYGVPASGITEAGKFSSYEEGIRVVASALKKSYIDRGLTDPEAIMQKYCPPSAEGAGTWAQHLNQWLAEMRFDDKKVEPNKIDNVNLTEFVPSK